MNGFELKTNNEDQQIDTTGQDFRQMLSRLTKSRRAKYWVFISAVLLMVGFLLIQSQSGSRSNDVASPSTFSQTELGDGWIRYEKLDERRFAISLPATWDAKILNVDDALDAIQEISKSDSNIATGMSNYDLRQLYKCCMKMYAVDSENQPHQSVSTLNMLVSPVKATTLDSFMQEGLAQLNKSTYTEPPESTRFQAINSEAFFIKYKLDLTLPGGEIVTMAVMQFSFLKDKQASVISISIMSNDPNIINQKMKTFEKIGESFEWL